MATPTTNFGLTKPAGADGYAIADHNNNSDKIDAGLTDATSFPTATGTGTAIVVSKPSILAYRNGLSFTFIASANNSGAATTLRVNALAIGNVYKPNTTDAPIIIAGKAYTVWTNGTNFFLQASAEGTATADKVLAGYTFSSDYGVGLDGTSVAVDTTSGTATADQILIGAKAWVAGEELTGTLEPSISGISFKYGLPPY